MSLWQSSIKNDDCHEDIKTIKYNNKSSFIFKHWIETAQQGFNKPQAIKSTSLLFPMVILNALFKLENIHWLESDCIILILLNIIVENPSPLILLFYNFHNFENSFNLIKMCVI